jgi:hypothetical protein
LYRTSTCDYVAVIGIDNDGDVVLRTVADGAVITCRGGWYKPDLLPPRGDSSVEGEVR